MRTRVTVLYVFSLGLFVFAVSASAQQYYEPIYTQESLSPVPRAPVFVENDTGGLLNVKFEVNGVLWPVRVMAGSWVSDLMIPVDGRMKVKEAKSLVLERNGTQEKDVKYCHYYSESRRKQGWYFYRGRSTGPCEQPGRSLLSRVLWPF